MSNSRLSLVCTFILLIGFLSVFISCENGYKNTISDEKMADILFDLHTAEILSSIKDTNERIVLAPLKDSAQLIELYHSVFSHHKISYDEFISNYYYYIHNRSADLDTIYRDIQQKIIDLQSIKVQTPEGENSINTEKTEDTLPVNTDEERKLRPELLNEYPSLEISE